MKRFSLSIVLAIIGSIPLIGQSLSSSNHPIIILNTSGKQIPDEPKINGSMKIVFNGEGKVNQITDQVYAYNGRIGIEVRGNSTQDFEKKTYSIELRSSENKDTSVNLLGMGGEEDWILHAMVIDKSQVRIPLSFYLAQRMGHYASEWRYVEVVLNNQYRGLYILTERIKRDDDRVDIKKLGITDISGDAVTGGYILRIDWLEDFEESDGFKSSFNSLGGVPMTYQWYYPKSSKIQPQQIAYIKNKMNEFEQALYSNSFRNKEGKRYTEYIDLNSFVDFLIINELSKNSDGYKLSSYLHKDAESRGGRFIAGPIWDFDQTYGVSLVCSCNDPTGWTYKQNQEGCEDVESMPMWWSTMMTDSVFTNRLKCRWNDFRTRFLHKDSIREWIINDTIFISEAVHRNFSKWNNHIGESIWAEPDPIPESYGEEISALLSWLEKRVDWMDSNIPGNCSNDVSSIGSVPTTNFKVYPNPVSSFLSVKRNSFNAEDYYIYTINGELVKQGVLEQGVQHIQVNDLTNGLYILRIGENALRLIKQ